MFSARLAVRATVLAAAAAAATGCAGARGRGATSASPASRSAALGGVWEGLTRRTVSGGPADGDTRIERQEWHLAQAGAAVSGYYVTALTVISGDGRAFVCSREPRFSSLVRFDVRGTVDARRGTIDLEETSAAVVATPCAPDARRLARYHARLQGNVLAVDTPAERWFLYRRPGAGADEPPLTLAAAVARDGVGEALPTRADRMGPAAAGGAVGPAADVSGVWIWEHAGSVPGGDVRFEREEWHVTQEGSHLSGTYDRLVRQISTDGQVFRCSMTPELRLTTRYQFTGEIRGREIAINERAFEVVDPNPCDTGRRRLDSYQGEAADGEIRLIWGGSGGQVLRRAAPDVPTQRF